MPALKYSPKKVNSVSMASFKRGSSFWVTPNNSFGSPHFRRPLLQEERRRDGKWYEDVKTYPAPDYSPPMGPTNTRKTRDKQWIGELRA